MAAISIPTGIFAALDPALLIPTLALVGALLFGAILVAFARRHRRRSSTLCPSPSDQLAQYRSLYEKGQISEEEYKRLRAVLGTEIRRAIDLPAAGKTPAANQAAGPAPEKPSSPEGGVPPSTGTSPP